MQEVSFIVTRSSLRLLLVVSLLLHRVHAFYPCHQTVTTKTPLAVAAPCTLTPAMRAILPRQFGKTKLSATPSRVKVSVPSRDIPKVVSEYTELQRAVVSLLREKDFKQSVQIIKGMMEYLEEISASLQPAERQDRSRCIDQACQAFYNGAFSPPFRGRKVNMRVQLGYELLNHQLSSGVLESPYDSVPKKTFVSALKALTSTVTGKAGPSPTATGEDGHSQTDGAYRILQRLVSGVGVRTIQPGRITKLYESDFNIVLNAYSAVGRMDMAHRVVALQERTHSAPGLSAVTYSILLKGYGKLGDVDNIDVLLTHAEAHGVVPDLIMLNSLIDAYINCGEWDKAEDVFQFTRDSRYKIDHETVLDEHSTLFSRIRGISANKRTYNTFIKGLASRGLLKDSMTLWKEMEHLDLDDHVTTNTLVKAAVNAHDLSFAEDLLKERTVATDPNDVSGYHPNAEAYTTLMDGYSKQGDIQNAIELMKTMKSRRVPLNEFTYTCMIGLLARSGKTKKAQNMISLMKSTGIRVGPVTYNSLISGLLHRDANTDDSPQEACVNDALIILREMMKEGVRPNAVTVSVIVDALGGCDHPRLKEAVSLVEKLENDGVIKRNNTRVATALVQIHGVSNDLHGAFLNFRKIKRPDTAAVNALIDACVRCENEKAALETFDFYFRGDDKAPRNRPDVMSFSVLMPTLLKAGDPEATREARKLYEEMKFGRRVMPDNALVDIILKHIVQKGQRGMLQTSDVRFVAGVLRDAESLEWRNGQLEGRKNAIRSVMKGRVEGTWKEEAELYGLLDTDDTEKTLFKRHGWNKVDSGFRLWGPDGTDPTTKPDKFLESKGWNDVDSGFRII